MKKLKMTPEKAARHVAKKIRHRFEWANKENVNIYSPEDSEAQGMGAYWTVEWEGMVDWAGEIAWYSMRNEWMGIKFRIDRDKIKCIPKGRNALNFINHAVKPVL